MLYSFVTFSVRKLATSVKGVKISQKFTSKCDHTGLNANANFLLHYFYKSFGSWVHYGKNIEFVNFKI